MQNIEQQMNEVITHLNSEFSKIRTGRANPNMLEGIKVEAYGAPTPIAQVAMISVPEARQLLVKPFDPSLLKEIDHAINKAELGINPTNDGENIRLVIPPLTEDSRKLLVKEASATAENAKVSIRNIRKNANNDIKKNKDLTDDEKKGQENDVQNLTDKFNKLIESEFKKKEKDIMTI